MSGPNDFNVFFGDNLDQWLPTLESRLRTADTAINHTKGLLDSLGATADSATGRVHDALRTGVGEHIVPAKDRTYDAALGSAASRLTDELVDSTRLAQTMAKTLGTTVRIMETLPAELKQAIANAKRAAGAGGGTNRDPTTGRTATVGTSGTYPTGTAEYAIAGQLNRALSKMDRTFGAGSTLAGKVPPLPAPGIRTVSQDQLSQAGVDRIVNAIEAQTRTLIEGLRTSRSTGGPDEPPPPGAAARAPAPPRASGQAVQLSAAELEEVRNHPKTQLQIAEATLQALRAQDQSDEKIRNAVQEQAKRRDDLAATVAKMDREERGVTRTQQREERRTTVAEDQAPPMTRSEAAARQQDLERILRTGADGFIDQVKKRGAAGISGAELKSTLDAFRSVGIDVAGGRTKEATGQNLQEAFARYRTQFGDTIPDQLRTGGQILPEDKISDQVRTLVGDLNGAIIQARQKVGALDALAANRAGGGGLPFKGAAEFGSGSRGEGVAGTGFVRQIQSGITTALETGFTRGAVNNARDILRVLPQEMRGIAFQQFQGLVGGKGFNPYDRELGAGIQGSGEEATSARLLLGALRDLTTASDAAAKQFYADARALEESRAFIERAENRSLRNQEEAAGTTDSARLKQLRAEMLNDQRQIDEAYDSIARNTREIESKFSAAQRELFGSAAFRQGFSVREGAGHLQAGVGPLAGERQAFEARRDAILGPSLRQDIKGGFAEGLIGFRTAIGSREQITNVPGARARNGVVEPIRYDEYSNADIIELRRASEHAAARQADERLLRSSLGVGPLNEGDQREVDEAAVHLENAATRLLNQMQKMFHVAPPIRAITGANPITLKSTAEDEYGRQLARDALAEAQARKFRTTEAQRLARAEGAVSATEKNLAGILESRVGVEERALRATAALAAAEAVNAHQIGEAGQVELAAAREAAAAADRAATALIKGGTGPNGEKIKSIGRLTEAELQRGGQANLLRGASTQPSDELIRQLQLKGAQGPLREVKGGAPQGPLGDVITQIEALDKTAVQARRRAQELGDIDEKVATEHKNATRAVDANIEAEKSYEAALARNRRELAETTAAQNQVRQIDAARKGLKKPDGSSITRGDIAEAMRGVPGGISKPEQVTDILGKARQSARDKSLASTDAKIHSSLAASMNEEERAAAGLVEATRALTAAEKKRADGILGKTIPTLAATSSGLPGPKDLRARSQADWETELASRSGKTGGDAAIDNLMRSIGSHMRVANNSSEQMAKELVAYQRGVALLPKVKADKVTEDWMARGRRQNIVGPGQDPFDEIRSRVAKAPPIPTPLYRGLQSAPGKELEMGLAAWTRDAKRASDFGKHILRVVGAQGAQIPGGPGDEMVVAEGKYRQTRSYPHPDDPSKTIYEVERVLEKAAVASRQLTGAEEARIAVLKAERAALQAQPHTRGDVKGLNEQALAAERALSSRRGLVTRYTNAGDEEKAGAARASLAGAEAEAKALREQATAAQNAREGLTRVNRELTALGAGRGSGRGAGAAPPAPPTGGGPGDGNEIGVLERILAVLNQIHGTLRGGLNVRGVTGTSIVGPGSTPAARARFLEPTVDEASPANDAAALAAAESRRQKLEAIGGLKPSDVAHQAEVEAKAQREAAAAAEQVTRAQIDEARANQVTADSLRQLSSATLAEISSLRQMNATGADAARIAEQEARVFNAVSNDLGRRHVGTTDRAFVAQQALRSAGSELDPKQLANVAQSARARTAFVDVGSQYGQAMAHGTQTGFARLFGTSGFFDRVINTTGTFIVRNFAAGLVFGLTNELEQAVTDAIKTQQTYVRLSSTLESTGKDVGTLRVDLQSLSSNYGVALNDLYNTAAKLAGVFDTPLDLEIGTKAVAQLQQISEGALDADEAVGVLTSIWAAFQDQLKDQGGAEHVADVATALQNLTGVNIEDTVEGVARISGLAKQMGISFEESATFVAQISRETNTTGATAGEQLSRILEQAQGPGGQTVLKQVLGQDLFDRNTENGAINYGNILKELIASWDGLSNAQQEALVHSLAGSRQAATFNALMDNGAKTLQNLTTATNSQGEAQDRMAKLMKTLAGETARFRSNFQNLVNELVQTGLLDSLGLVAHGVNMLLHLLDHLLALLNHLGDSNAFAGSLIHMTAFLGGAIVAGKLLIGTIRGIKAATAANATTSALFGLGGAGGAATGGVVAGSAASDLAATNIAVSSAEEKRLASALRLSATMDALNAAEVEVATTSQARVLVERERMALIQTGTATEAELAAANEAVVAADARLVAAVTTRTAAEAEAAAAAGLSSAGGAAGAGAKGGLIAGARGLATNPVVLGVVAAVGAAIAVGVGQHAIGGRLQDAAKISGGEIDQSATSDELKAAAKSYREAADEAKSKANQGIFGLPGDTDGLAALSRIVDKSFRGSEDYDAADRNAANQRSIAVNLTHAAEAVAHIEDRNRRQLAGGDVNVPDFTSFDTDYLTQRLQDLSANGQSAGQQLNELNDTLFGIGAAAKAAKGAFLANGRPTNSLPDWLTTATPGLQKILADQGLDASSTGAALRQRLGLEHQETVGTKSVVTPGRAVAVEEVPDIRTVKNSKTEYTAKNTAQAIKQTTDELLAGVAKELDLGDTALSDRQLAKLATKDGYGEAVEKYRTVQSLLKDFFRADEKSLSTLMGQAVLSHKDAITLANGIEQLTEQQLSALPETDLNGRRSVLQGKVRKLQGEVARTKGRTPTQLLILLQQAQNELAEVEIAQVDRTRQAAQSADHSKAGLYRAGMAATHRAISVALKHGDADLLAQVIANSGKAGQALAIAAIRNMQKELNAYKRAEAALAAVAATANATLANALQEGLGRPTPPGFNQKDLNQFLQAAHIPTGKTKDSTYFTGSDVPGLDDAAAQKADAGQLRADHAALVQARLGVAAAYADARGDAVAAARIQVRIAAASIAAARADLGAAKNLDERLQAQAAIYQAQAQLIAAHAAVAQSQADLVQSQFDVSIALAEAAGRTVEAARRRAAQAQAALRAALRKSGGKRTAEVNQARAGAIAAEAAVRDAKLQDELDTINFNLEMGRITQSAAIHALQHILATEKLTREQRRSLLLQIKGMKDEMADSQWNFGDIKLPTPYQMRRYIEQRKQDFRNQLDSAAVGAGGGAGRSLQAAAGTSTATSHDDHRVTYIRIDGADLKEVRKLLKEVVGGHINLRTTGPRRGNR